MHTAPQNTRLPHGGTPATRGSSALPLRSGVGLKPEHFKHIIEVRPDMGFFEIHAENYFIPGGPFHHYLSRIRERYALSIHGVGLSIGGEGPLDRDHLHALRALIERYQPESFSEHLAWSSHGGAFLNDLLPLPYTSATLNSVCTHIDQVQTLLGRRMLLENPATYVEFAESSYSETDFINAILQRTGCGLLLDINNVYVSCVNHGRDAASYLRALPPDAIGEIHLAGFSREQDSLGAPLLIDSHGSAVDSAVWRLYAEVIERIGVRATLIEWDNAIPAFETLCEQAQRADAILANLSLREVEAL